jgi:pyruvate formate lyase activating enzyme
MNSSSGIIFDIKRFAVHDGPGIRTTIFFKGCTLNCWYCHNPESQNPSPEPILRPNSNETEIIGRTVTIKELMEEIRKEIIFYDDSGGGVTVSGGEPLFQPDFLLNLLCECFNEEIHTAIDTTGYGSLELVKRLQRYVNLYLYDLKLINDTKHQYYTGVSNKIILENLKYLDSQNETVFIRIPIIPTITDTDENLQDLQAFLATLDSVKQINLLPYNRFGEGKYHRLNREYKYGPIDEIPTLTKNELNNIKYKFESIGFDVQIGG